MAEHFLTYDVFKRGIRIYLQQNQFGVVQPTDLYDAFQEALNVENLHDSLNNLTVKEILSTWDSSSGYPLVNAYRSYENNSLALIQNSFSRHNIFTYGHIWYIPISVMLQYNTNKSNYDNSKTTPDYWLTRKYLQIDNFTSDGWILINKLQTGYYRVNYDITNWERLSEFLYYKDFNLIHVVNRAQLIDDAFNLAKWDYILFEIPLNLSKYLTRETHYLPLASFLGNISSFKSALTFTDTYRNFQNYIISILNGAYNYLGFEEKVGDSHLDKLNRINILTWFSDMGHQEYRDFALKKFREWKSNKTSLSADMEVPIFCGAMQIGTIEDWNYLYEKYQLSTEKDQKMRMFSSLACSGNETILKR
ncbi:hypothetical protein ILUMI_05010 [Ignelater luminosus]|uniref:ERAP1-like C-terminal domain-containing protein n=1 Tax=Ignelater luminosus TaxID=2038154 RepID=A0A8K0D7W8_IGNLU|nr:hypothetical protein ILUMI_05010 [Ignelater luminosus]